MMCHEDTIDLSTTSNQEKRAQDLVERGDIDQAIAIYQQLKPQSARIFYTMGMLYANKTGNYKLAISCFEKALQLQKENGEDISNSLTRLGFTYQHLHQFELALNYHCRALNIRQLQPNIDQRLLASNLFGIANAYWGQQQFSDALTYAQQALKLNRSIQSENEVNIAANLAILANIYHHCGDDFRALEFAKESLALFESCLSPNSFELASVLNNMGAIQLSIGLFDDALVTFIRALHICENTVPEEHPKRIAITRNIQCIIEMQQRQQDAANPLSHWWQLSSKLLLF